MKNYKEITETVLNIRDSYLERQKERHRKTRKVLSICSSVCAFAVIIGVAGHYNYKKPPVITDPITSTISELETTQSDISITTMTSSHITVTTSYNNKTSKTISTSSAIATSKNQSITTQKTDTNINDTTISNFTKETTKSSISDTVVTHSSEIPLQTTTSKSETGTTSRIVQTTRNESRTEIVEIVTLPKWDEKTITEQFPEFEYNGKEYSLRDKTAADEDIDCKLGNITLTGCDYSTNTYHTINVDVFKIKNISDKCNVAVKFEGIEAYYVYFCRDYCPQTLGELMDDIDIENTLSINDMYVNGSSIVSDNTQEVLLTLFNSCREVRNEIDYPHHKIMVSFSTDIPILGVNNKSMAFTNDGYLITNIMDYGYSFYIGEEKVNEFCKQLDINETKNVNTPINNEEMVME